MRQGPEHRGRRQLRITINHGRLVYLAGAVVGVSLSVTEEGLRELLAVYEGSTRLGAASC